MQEATTTIEHQDRSSDPAVKAAAELLVKRNVALNTQNRNLALPQKETPGIRRTAERIIRYERLIINEVGDRTEGRKLAGEFLRDPYRLTWIEQILAVDPKKTTLALQVKNQVNQLALTGMIDAQFAPAIALGAFVGIEKLQALGVEGNSLNEVIAKLRGAARKNRQWEEGNLYTHMDNYLTSMSREGIARFDNQTKKRLVADIAQEINGRLAREEKDAKFMGQSQGVEVEVLSRLETPRLGEAVSKYRQIRLDRAKRLGIMNWLPRGIKPDELKRKDWYLVTMLGLKEDMAEKSVEHFEMATKPTHGGAAQSTILYELAMGGFVTPEILSDKRETHSLHVSTTFPNEIWNERAKTLFTKMGRAFAGAFSSQQRGVYGGYIVDDYRIQTPTGREVADKTIESKKFQPVVGQGTESIANKRLVEQRMHDLTERGQYAVMIHKPYLDYGFRCFMQRETGVPLKRPADIQAAEAWQKFYQGMEAIYQKYNVPDSWLGVGWTKVKKPELQRELSGLIRKNAAVLRRIVRSEDKVREVVSLSRPDQKSSFILGKKKIEVARGISETTGEPQIYLSLDECRKLGVDSGGKINFRLGTKVIPVRVQGVRNERRPDTMVVDQRIGAALGVPGGQELTVRIDPLRGELALGPVIGVMANIREPNMKTPYGTQTSYHEAIIKTAREAGMLAYVFDPRTVNSASKTAEAMTTGVDSTGRTIWKKISVPLPDVIFDRNFVGMPAGTAKAISGIPFVNSREFTNFVANKARLPDYLRQNAALVKYIPETKPFADLAILDSMLTKYGTIIMKPTWGMRSSGIIMVSRGRGGEIRYNYTKETVAPDTGEHYNTWANKNSLVAKNLSEMLRLTESVRQGQGEYLVQRRINVAYDRIEGETELRILFQRAADGKLETVGWNEFQKERWNKAFKRVFGEKNGEAITTNVELMAKGVAYQIQKSFGANFGQMTVQLAVDTSGQPALIEVNPKPGVGNQFTAYEVPQMIESSAQQLMHFAGGLSGFSEQSVATGKFGLIELNDGRKAEIIEEHNPQLIYSFAQSVLGPAMNDTKHYVYNLKDLETIKANLARGARYYVARAGREIIGCRATLPPAIRQYRGIKNPTNIYQTRPVPELIGNIVSPKYRGFGIGSTMCEVALRELRKKGYTKVLADITGTYDPKQPGVPRPDSIPMLRIVEKYKRSLIGCGILSYGPNYILDITDLV